MLNRELVACGLFRNQAQAVTGSVATGLTATGTTQATALLLRSAINNFGTVGASTGARLPAGCAMGDEYVIYNGGAETLAVYPPVGGSINGGSTNAGVNLAAGNAMAVYCTASSGLTFLSVSNATSSAAASGLFTTVAASTSATSPLLTAGASGTAGLITVFPTTGSKGKTTLGAADNTGNTTTALVTAEQAGARTYTVPDAGGNAAFVMTAGAQTIAGVKTFSNGIIGAMDTGVAAAGCTLTGASLVADGTDAAIDIAITPKGTGALVTTNLSATGLVSKTQGAPNAQTVAATLTIANLLTGIVTGTHSAGATAAYTLPTGTLVDAGLTFANDESFDWVLINLSAAAVDTITLTAGADHTIVGNPIVQSAHASTGGVYGNSAQFRTRKTAANTYVTYRIA